MSIKGRCANKRHRKYGAKGIKVCPEWQTYIPFKEWSLANGYKPELQIDRIDGTGDYCPSNCRWVTVSENNKNRRRWKWSNDARVRWRERCELRK